MVADETKHVASTSDTKKKCITLQMECVLKCMSLAEIINNLYSMIHFQLFSVFKNSILRLHLYYYNRSIMKKH